ncbi:MAG: hypothetical protein A2541_02860 [Candidatus Taylorbacteria bacterium RIFOXYD2_FULL_36_9]|uniref:Chloroplast import component protein (Tic20) n=1 Tax=Candidatus Taylorbacteria bacterium RIFOXYD2_FULL_36_9 TaxID=1802338 RepID=A0A1G2PCS6_9BACT|nr:MAG: hypothetical protein A2541_02860 [Candidatus Taylorbacteria bacterium RIFOXYD2_FULL_36_9]
MTNMEQNLNQQVLAENSNHEIDHDKLCGIVAYFLFLIPLLVVKNRSSFLNYHINQGIILLLVVVIGNFGLDFLPFWLAILAWFKGLWNVAMVALLIIGIKNVLERKTLPLPVIGKLFTFLK